MARLPDDGLPPDWSDLFQRAAEDIAERQYSILVGKIKSFDASTDSAEVELLTPFTDSKGREQQFPVIPGASVYFPVFGNYSMRAAPAKGDNCLVLLSSVSIAQWKGGADPGAPLESKRRGSLTDAIVLCGLKQFKSPVSKPSGIAIGSSGTYYQATSGTANIRGAAINMTAAVPEESFDIPIIEGYADVVLVSAVDDLTLAASEGIIDIGAELDISIHSDTAGVSIEAATEVLLGSISASDPVALASLVHAELVKIAASLASIVPPVPTPYVAPLSAALIGSTKVKADS